MKQETTLIKTLYLSIMGSTVLAFFAPAWFGVLAAFIWIGFVIFAYIKRAENIPAIARSHYSNYITVFWIMFGATAITALITGLYFIWFLFISLAPWNSPEPFGSKFVLIGFFGALLWAFYRLIKGGIRIWKNRPFGSLDASI